MQRYDNPMKAALLRGERRAVLWLTLTDPAMTEIAAHAGAEGILFDAQHGTWSRESLERAIGVVPLDGPVPLARPQVNSDQAILECLDSGALGLIVPMVNTAEQAAAAVRSAKYAPEGHRSVGGMRPASDLPRYVEIANKEILIAVMVETVEALENVDAIAAVDGVDMVFIGPTDLSLSLGTFPEGGPKLEAAIDRVLEATVAAGKIPGIFTISAAQAQSRFDQGFRFTVASVDSVAVGSVYRHALAALNG